ncbi:hypothetical protein CHKEEEPN_4420 [Methylorubrum podarium]|nr:hypothetical protein CHKEEEPN_4420 [Methylorubrum podarium]
MAKKAQGRQHPVDRAQERLGGIDAAAEEALAKRQQVEQQLHREARIAGAVAAVGQDLRVEFAHEDPGRPAQDRLDALATEARVGQRHRGEQARLRRRRAAQRAFQLPRALADGLEEGLVEGVVGALQHQRRLAQERDQPPGGHRHGAGADGLAAPAHEVRDEGAGVGAGERRVGGAEVAQPAEAVERVRPFGRGGIVIERGAPAHHQRAAREDEQAGIDVVGERGVAGAQVVRRDDEAGHPRAGEDLGPRREPRRPLADRAHDLVAEQAVELPAFGAPAQAVSSEPSRWAARVAARMPRSGRPEAGSGQAYALPLNRPLTLCRPPAGRHPRNARMGGGSGPALRRDRSRPGGRDRRPIPTTSRRRAPAAPCPRSRAPARRWRR